uniref:Hypothetical salivary protein 16 n=1 Tax=Simulium nigrimanum TaxID=683695 RepID=D1FQ38_SIMNI
MGKQFVTLWAIATLIGLAVGQANYGNLIASNIGAMTLQVYDTGIINCDNFICPKSTYKCIVDKITDEKSTRITKSCHDANGQIVDKEEADIPNLTSETNYRRSYAEADIHGRVVVKNHGYGGDNFNYQQTGSVGNQLTPEDIERLRRLQQDINDYTIRLQQSIQSQVQDTLNRIRNMQFPFVR